MKTKLMFLLLVLINIQNGLAQLPADVYRKPLKGVLADIEKRYDISLRYGESLVKGVEVMYPTWRYRLDTGRNPDKYPVTAGYGLREDRRKGI